MTAFPRSRREFLALSGRFAALLCVDISAGGRLLRRLPGIADPFSLGVASGDPTADGVVLWTRLAPEPFVPGGGLPLRPIAVRWEVARDEGFRQIAQRGEATATPELGHSVHVEVSGLEPGRPYWYRFTTADGTSPVGRAFTAPAPGAGPSRIDFAMTSCQHYEQGLYTAHEHLAREDVTLNVHLGDYIYEGGIARNAAVRRHNSVEITTLEAYRNRYALYKSDPNLQGAHAAFPWIVTWDDHEVENNYAADRDENGTDPATFLLRRAAGYQAFYEHMPLRRSSMPRGPEMQLYRRLAFGSLATFHVLDTRQYRTDQPCGDGNRVECAAVHDAGATILGAGQERWLHDGLRASGARWNVLANQVPLAPLGQPNQNGLAYSMDKWSGYVRERNRLLEVLSDPRVSNPVLIAGDVHVNWVADVRRDPDAEGSAMVSTEFVGTSISSGGNGMDLSRGGERLLAANPQLRFYNAQRGYVRCALTRERWVSDYRVVAFVDQPGAPVATRASFVVSSGTRGVERA